MSTTSARSINTASEGWSNSGGGVLPRNGQGLQRGVAHSFSVVGLGLGPPRTPTRRNSDTRWHSTFVCETAATHCITIQAIGILST